jgi:hypothetical protein
LRSTRVVGGDPTADAWRSRWTAESLEDATLLLAGCLPLVLGGELL